MFIFRRKNQSKALETHSTILFILMIIYIMFLASSTISTILQSASN